MDGTRKYVWWTRAARAARVFFARPAAARAPSPRHPPARPLAYTALRTLAPPRAPRRTPRGRIAMIADPESLGSEPFVQVGALIERDVEPILDRWQRCATEEQPNARRLHHASLRDHLPDLLRALAASLAADGNGHTNG